MRKAIYIAALLFCLTLLAFAAYYLFSSYRHLQSWYIGLNPCFYKSSSWSASFFTPEIKAQGNLFCLIGMVTAAGIVVLSIRRLRQKAAGAIRLRLKMEMKELPWYLALAIITAALWYWGNTAAPPSFDEIFSAVNCAEMHPFHTLSYYMLPNNHLLFNLVNGVLFHSVDDKVLSGRIISLVGYMGTIMAVYFWFRKATENRPFALIAACTIALQFVVWAFGAQARGYSLYLFAGWLAFISLMEYLQSSKKGVLLLNSIACVVGYALLPSFLYFHVAQLVFAAAYQLYKKKLDWNFWKYQLLIGAAVFLFYLPALCFSGYQALAQNKYVAASAFTHTGFLPQFFTMYKYYLSFCFSGLGGKLDLFSYGLLLLPVTLLFFKRERKPFPVFFICIWLVTGLIIFWMMRPPFTRVLNFHFSLLLAMDIYAIYRLTSMLFGNKPALTTWIASALVLLLTFHFIRTDQDRLRYEMYGNDIYEAHRLVTEGVNTIPHGSTVGFTDESFYWFYECRKKGLKVSRCPDGQEQFMIRNVDEPFPAWMRGRYILFQTVWEYEIYKKL